MPDCEQMLRRQQALADFGEFALRSEDLDEVLNEACRIVSAALGTRRAKILEIEPDGQWLFVRAGTGWGPGIVGRLRMPTSEHSSETFAIAQGKPVISRDIGRETRFEIPPFMKEAGIVAMANVPILLPGRRNFGLLQVDATEPRDFGAADTEFLRTYTMILGPVIDRLHKARDLGAREARDAFLLTLSDHLRSALDAPAAISAALELFAIRHGIASARYLVPDSEGERFDIAGRFSDGRMPATAAGRMADFGSDPAARLRAGHAIFSDRPESGTARWDAGGSSSAIPLIRGVRLVALFTTAVPAPHSWSPTERGLQREVAERICDAVERFHADAAVRDSEAKYRHLFNSIDEGFCLIEMQFDGLQRPIDYRILSVNPAFEHQTGIGNATGRTIRELIPGLEAHWFETFGRIARTGVPERFEYWTRTLGRWYDGYAFRIGPPARRQVAVLFKDILVRKHAEEALRDSEARFRAFVTASSDVVYRMNPDWSQVRRLKGPGQADGADESIDTLLERDIPPRDRETVRAAIAEAISSRSLFDLEHRTLGSDGTLGWTHSRAVPILSGEGKIKEWLGSSTDVTAMKEEAIARTRAEEALRESEGRLSQFGEASQDVLWIRDARTFQWLYLTPAFEVIYGLDRTTAFSGDNMIGWMERILPEDRDRALACLERVRAGERVTFEYRIRKGSDGEIRWLRDTDFPMRDAAGTVCWIGGIGRDMTEEKRTAEHMTLLVGELQHRTRNLMGIVRIMADKTMEHATGLADFNERYTKRLSALARVQGLLSRLKGNRRITFGELIRSEIDALGDRGSRITLEGPGGVALRSGAVQIFALALHELATNAAKYGAFSQPHGQLAVRWRVDRPIPGGEPWLHVDWRERGVVMPAPGTAHRTGETGAGRELIERALPYQIGARTSFALGPDGVHCTISLPVSRQQTSEEKPDA